MLRATSDVSAALIAILPLAGSVIGKLVPQSAFAPNSPLPKLRLVVRPAAPFLTTPPAPR